MFRNTDRSGSVARSSALTLRIEVDDLSGPEIAALLSEHLSDMNATSPVESVHALDLAALRAPEITLWSGWDEATLAGCAALKDLGGGHAEIKSMRTARTHRRRGVAALLLRHLIDDATARGYHRLSLETGTPEFFVPAQKLYAANGFEFCPPFGSYQHDPYSVFMTRTL